MINLKESGRNFIKIANWYMFARWPAATDALLSGRIVLPAATGRWLPAAAFPSFRLRIWV